MAELLRIERDGALAVLTFQDPERLNAMTEAMGHALRSAVDELSADAGLRAAVERYAVHHPVLDDPQLVTWQAYTARAWPTLVLVDPEGYVVAQYAGEGHAHAIDRLLGELVKEHRTKGTLQPGGSPYVPPEVEPTTLRFPADAVPLGPSVLVSDAGYDRVVELDERTLQGRLVGPAPAEVVPAGAAEGLDRQRPSGAHGEEAALGVEVRGEGRQVVLVGAVAVHQ